MIVNMRAAPHMGLGDHIFEVQLHVRTFFDDQPNGGARILRMSDDLVGRWMHIYLLYKDVA